jgi:hypothetical protein
VQADRRGVVLQAAAIKRKEDFNYMQNVQLSKNKKNYAGSENHSPHCLERRPRLQQPMERMYEER